MEGKLRRLGKWVQDEKAEPHRLEIHPTNRCNLKCKMCGTRAAWREEEAGMKELIRKNTKKELSEERFLKLIDEASDLGVERILLTGGGEPFVRKNLVLRMMEHIKDEAMFGNINTNGVLLNEEEIRRIVKMRWDLVIFSIDSPKAEVHDRLRGDKGTFQKAIENLTLFKKIKRNLGKCKPEIAFNTVITEENYRELPELVELAESVDCNDITLIPLISPNKYPELKVEDEESLVRKLEEMERVADEKNMHNNVDEVLQRHKEKMKEGENNNNGKRNEKHNIKCFEPFLNLVVRMDGQVTPCCMIDDRKENIKNKSLDEVWNGGYYQNLRRKFRQGEIPEGCKECILSKETRNKELQDRLHERIN